MTVSQKKNMENNKLIWVEEETHRKLKTYASSQRMSMKEALKKIIEEGY